MSKPTSEQIAEFKRWEQENKEKPVSPEVIKKIIDDDVQEESDVQAKRANWDRTYNHPPGPAEKRQVAEEE